MANPHPHTPLPDYATVTEVAGEEITCDQLARMCHRYRWAADYCRSKDVLEVACGSGQGLGYLLRTARSVRAGDIMPGLVATARTHYRDRVSIEVMDATALPVEASSIDVLILFEAIYYIRDTAAFMTEAQRVLRPSGTLLIASANKDLPDFNPSPFAHTYFGAVELHTLMRDHGLDAELFGAWNYLSATPIQRLLVPVKKAAVTLGVMPKTMTGKRFLKRMIFGRLTPMPAEIDPDATAYSPPRPIDATTPDRAHRVIYCAARKADKDQLRL